MRLKIFLPFKLFLDQKNVIRIVAENKQGHFGLLPQRLDCVSTLGSGILVYEIKNDGERFVALDEGILVKKGDEVLITTRNAMKAENLDQLYEITKKDFFTKKESEKNLQLSFQKIESLIIHQLKNIVNG